MRINNNSAWVMPALDVIKNTAPKMYAEMQATDWNLTVINSGDDLIPTFKNLVQECGFMDSYGLVGELAANLDHAYGVTVAITDQSPEGAEPPPLALTNATYLNRINLEGGAKDMEVPLPKMIADTMVHEFVHRKGHGEDPAYEMGAKFARAMGEEKLAESQEETGAGVHFESFLDGLLRGE
jgi:hypothetical protein